MRSLFIGGETRPEGHFGIIRNIIIKIKFIKFATMHLHRSISRSLTECEPARCSPFHPYIPCNL